MEDDKDIPELVDEVTKSFEVIDATTSSEFIAIKSESHSAIDEASHSEFSQLSQVIEG